MRERRGFQVRLSKPERQELNRLLGGGLQPLRTVLRALALRQLAVGRETVRVLLESHDLKPWREKNVVGGSAG